MEQECVAQCSLPCPRHGQVLTEVPPGGTSAGCVWSPLPWNPESDEERGTKQNSAKFVLFHKPLLKLHFLHQAQLGSFLLWLTFNIYYHHQLVPNQELLSNKSLTVGTMNAKSHSVQEAQYLNVGQERDRDKQTRNKRDLKENNCDKQKSQHILFPGTASSFCRHHGRGKLYSLGPKITYILNVLL